MLGEKEDSNLDLHSRSIIEIPKGVKSSKIFSKCVDLMKIYQMEVISVKRWILGIN
jgi:hypothetical protein